MPYVLLASLLLAVGWGLKSAVAIPHPDLLTVAVSSIVVLIGSVFWVVLTLHGLDLIVALQRSNRAFVSDFVRAIRPRPRELLIATPLTVLALLMSHQFVGTAGAVVAALDVPFYALAVAAAMSASPRQRTISRWRMGLMLSAVYIALFCISTGLHAWVATRPAIAAAAPWLGVTSAITAVVAFVSASKFRSSIELGRALGSPVLDELGGRQSAIESASRRTDGPAGPRRGGPASHPPRPPKPPSGRRKSRRRS